MKVIKPTALGDAMLVSSSATETVATYNAATDYALNDQVVFGNAIYSAIQTPNSGNTPGSAPLFWLRVGPTNRWAMFDAELSTQTAQATSLTLVIKPGYVNSLGLFGLEGTALVVTVRNGLTGPIVYGPKTIDLDGTLITNLYEYIYEPSVQRGEAVLTDLPTYADAHITVSITSEGVAKCGNLLLGQFYILGETQYGASAGIIDYSRKDTDAFGVSSFVRRKFSKRASVRLMLNNDQLNKVQSVLADLRATPCAWIGTDALGYEPLTLFGFYRDFSIDIEYVNMSYCNLEIEGL